MQGICGEGQSHISEAWKERMLGGYNLLKQEICLQWTELSIVYMSPKNEARNLLMLGKLCES